MVKNEGLFKNFAYGQGDFCNMVKGTYALEIDSGVKKNKAYTDHLRGLSSSWNMEYISRECNIF